MTLFNRKRYNSDAATKHKLICDEVKLYGMLLITVWVLPYTFTKRDVLYHDRRFDNINICFCLYLIYLSSIVKQAFLPL